MSKLINYSDSESDSESDDGRKTKMEPSKKFEGYAIEQNRTSSNFNVGSNREDLKEYNNYQQYTKESKSSRDYNDRKDSTSKDRRDDLKDYSRELANNKDSKDKKRSRDSSSHKSYKDKERDRYREKDYEDRRQKKIDRGREYSSRDKYKEERNRRSEPYQSSRSRTDRRSDRNERDRNEKAHYNRDDRKRSKSRERTLQSRESHNFRNSSEKTFCEIPNKKVAVEVFESSTAFMLPKSKSPEIQLPSYYNPAVVNPNKFAEQVQKRKLIWGNKKNEESANKWARIGSALGEEGDGKTASKFMRLMGIKSAPKAESTSTSNEIKPNPTDSNTDVKRRAEMFTSMEKQYEVARQVTHTMRGVGFGFGSQKPY